MSSTGLRADPTYQGDRPLSTLVSVKGSQDYLNYTESIHKNLDMIRELAEEMEGLLSPIMLPPEAPLEADKFQPNDPTELSRNLQSLLHKSEITKQYILAIKSRIRI